MTMPRLLDLKFSKGFEVIKQLLGHDDFHVGLVRKILQSGGADRAVRALQREFFPPAVEEGDKPVIVIVTGTENIRITGAASAQRKTIVYGPFNNRTEAEHWVREMHRTIKDRMFPKIRSDQRYGSTGVSTQILDVSATLRSDSFMEKWWNCRTFTKR